MWPAELWGFDSFEPDRLFYLHLMTKLGLFLDVFLLARFLLLFLMVGIELIPHVLSHIIETRIDQLWQRISKTFTHIMRII